MPGNTVWPIRAERGGITTSARPERRLNRVAVTSAAESSARKARCRSAARRADGGGVAAHDQDVALGQRRAAQRTAGVAGLDRHQGDAGIGGEIDGARIGAEIGRGRPDAQLEDAVVQRVVLDQRARMLAQVGGDRLAAAVRQQARAEEQDDGHRAEEQRHADPGELEIAEGGQAGIDRGIGDQDVHRRAGQRQQRAGMAGEDQAASAAARAAGRAGPP